MKHIVVELETGEQESFDDAYHAFLFAREQENKQRHSVLHVAVGEGGSIYRGNQLRHLLRALDIKAWIRAGNRTGC